MQKVKDLFNWIKAQFMKFGQWVKETLFQVECAVEAVWSMLDKDARASFKQRLLDEYDLVVEEKRADRIGITVA